MFSMSYGDRDTSPTPAIRRTSNETAPWPFPMSPSSELALTEQYPPAEYRGPQALKRAIAERYEHLDNGGQDQYLSFRHVSLGDFETIESRRIHLGGKGVAFTYFGDIETLIIKVPTEAHEAAHSECANEVLLRLRGNMRLDHGEFYQINATKFKGGNSSSKEGDSAFRNKLITTNHGSWPHFVIEAGYSENLQRLRTDARWWIENSRGQVYLVLVIWLNPSTKSVKIEKWIPSQPPLARHSPRLNQSSGSMIMTAEISIDQSSTTSVISGAPLRLEFDKLVGRPAQRAGEGDVVFTRNDLDRWARLLWLGI